jgi:hypothetical protein
LGGIGNRKCIAMETTDDKGNELPKEKKHAGLKEFFSVGEVFGYFFRSKKKDEIPNINTRIMHGINRIAIAVFLAGIFYLVLKRFL